jgi:hypothetical protein
MKKIAWLFLVTIALMSVPASHASAAKAGWNIDGTEPPAEPIPLPHG